MGFASDVRKFCKEEAPEYIDTVIRRTVIEAGRRVIMRSPVGDGKYWKRPPPPGYVGGRFRGTGSTGSTPLRPASWMRSICPEPAHCPRWCALRCRPRGRASTTSQIIRQAERIENGWSRQAPQASSV